MILYWLAKLDRERARKLLNPQNTDETKIHVFKSFQSVNENDSDTNSTDSMNPPITMTLHLLIQ